MWLSDYFLKKYVKDQYERMSMEPNMPNEKEPERLSNKNVCYGSAWSKEVEESKRKMEERINTSWYGESLMNNRELYKKLQRELDNNEKNMTDKSEPPIFRLEYDERGYLVQLREKQSVITEHQTQSKGKSMSIK